MSYYASTNIPKSAASNSSTHQPRNALLRNSLITAAAFSGMVVGVAASLGVALPMLHAESIQNKVLSQKIVSMVPADNLSQIACAVPAETPAVASGQVLGAAVAAPVGGQGGGAIVTPNTTPVGGAGGGSAPQTFVQNLIGGQIAKNEATIENTGPNSNNQITQTNTNTTKITNTNTISVSNSNSQQASSGIATVSNNTNAGNATSGEATNTNSTNLNISVKNQ